MEDEASVCKVFTKLPPELWDNIISSGTPNLSRQLCKPLSLVSHSFRDFFQPLLFSSINLFIPARANNPDFLRCLEFLQAPRILNAIRRCTVRAIGPDFAESELLRHEGIGLILERVTAIEFISVIFGDSERDVFLRLKRVREIKLQGCSCSLFFTKKHLTRYPSPPAGSKLPLLNIQRIQSERSWNSRVLAYWLSLTSSDALQHISVTEGHNSDVHPSFKKTQYRNVKEITTDTFRDWTRFGELIACCPSITTLRITTAPRNKAPQPWKIPLLRYYSGTSTVQAIEAVVLPNPSLVHIQLEKCNCFQMYRALAALTNSKGHRRGVQSISLKMVDMLTVNNPFELFKEFEDLRAVEVSVSDAKPDDRKACVTALLKLLEQPTQRLPKTLEFLAFQISARLPSSNGVTPTEWNELTDILGRVFWTQTHPFLSRIYVFDWDSEHGPSVRDAYDVRRGKWLGKSGHYETWEGWVREAM
ncbi:hypothetical protein BDN72DRAFT_161898 [Pluteus cervinus]|uniref:Uncharacterized protein n=1 Tax=Pluteus cervinus TaxID=181527 RepID=A0ACD3AKL2_9AGAR|nr:hypothetical protein BDN72DRAFT_161898 [Pluteus cervinus]